MVGLYETALDDALLPRSRWPAQSGRRSLLQRPRCDGPKRQIRRTLQSHAVDIFPPPGPDRRDSFFALTVTPQESNARLYLGVAAQGRSPKVVMLRVYLALLAASQKWYSTARQEKDPKNPADPYMTLFGYYNSLRELGGARRLIEDEVRNRLAGLLDAKADREAEGLFEDRQIDYEPVELTSRVSTARVSEAKRRLALPFGQEKGHVDVAIATNMISVGLDITRLGLMVVFGQPKTSAEYIQATSRVGRDRRAAGLGGDHLQHPQAARPLALRAVRSLSRDVLSKRGGHKRDAVFAPGAGSRAWPARWCGWCAQGHAPMTPPRGAAEILSERARLDFAVECLLASGPAIACDAAARGGRTPASSESASGRSICSTNGARWPWNSARPAWACSTDRSRGRPAAALRFPQPRAEEPAAHKPEDEVPRQSLDCGTSSRASTLWVKTIDGWTWRRTKYEAAIPATKPQGEIRQSQVVTTFGPGAMVDLPKHSVLVGGLDYWSQGGDGDLRAAADADKLAAILGVPSVRLNTPRRPIRTIRLRPRPDIDCFQFPEWFITQDIESAIRDRSHALAAAGPPQGSDAGQVHRPEQEEAGRRPGSLRPGLPLRPYRGHRLVHFRSSGGRLNVRRSSDSCGSTSGGPAAT